MNVLKENRKDTSKTLIGKENHKVTLQWSEKNLISMRGYVDSEATAYIIENIRFIYLEDQVLAITRNNQSYKGIRTIDKDSLDREDLKVVDDILLLFPEYSLVVFDDVETEQDWSIFYKNIKKLAKKYQNVIFVLIKGENINDC